MEVFALLAAVGQLHLKRPARMMGNHNKDAAPLPVGVGSILSSMLPAAVGLAVTIEEPLPNRHLCQEYLLDFVEAELEAVKPRCRQVPNKHRMLSQMLVLSDLGEQPFETC